MPASIRNTDLVIRKVIKSDVEILFNWINEEDARKNSFNSSPIEFEDHKEWFTNKLNSKNDYIFIFELEQIPVGYVRFDYNQHSYLISVLVARDYRGKGISSTMIKTATQLFHSTSKLPVYANIRVENLASIKAFENSGFEFVKKAIINNSDGYIYKLDNLAK